MGASRRSARAGTWVCTLVIGVAALPAAATGQPVAPTTAPDGALDPRFGVGRLVTTDFGAPFGEEANAVVVQRDGKLVAAGSANQENGGDIALAR